MFMAQFRCAQGTSHHQPALRVRLIDDPAVSRGDFELRSPEVGFRGCAPHAPATGRIDLRLGKCTGPTPIRRSAEQQRTPRPRNLPPMTPKQAPRERGARRYNSSHTSVDRTALIGIDDEAHLAVCGRRRGSCSTTRSSDATLLTGRRGHAPGDCWSVTRPWPAGRGLAAPEANVSNPRAAWVWSADPCAPPWPSSTGVSAPRYARRWRPRRPAAAPVIRLPGAGSCRHLRLQARRHLPLRQQLFVGRPVRPRLHGPTTHPSSPKPKPEPKPEPEPGA